MPSKGSQIVPVRFEAEQLSLMKRTIAQRNEVTQLEPWTMSDFIRTAVAEKLAHMERSRKGRKR